MRRVIWFIIVVFCVSGFNSNCFSAGCGDTTRVYNLYDMMSEIDNSNGPGTLGPRRLVTNQTSQVEAFFERMFVQPTPMDIDTIHMNFKKLDGTRIGGKVTAVVCATDPDGQVTRLDEFTFSGGRKNIGQTFSKTYTGIKGDRLSVHMVGKDLVGHSKIEIDLKRSRTEGALWEPDRTAPAGTVPGFADIHVHQAAQLGYGNGWYWGDHMPGSLEDRLPPCTGENHAILEPLGIQVHELANAHTGQTNGAPDFEHWPIWNDIKHQQVAAQWLKEAHDRGLNLMVASVVNFQALAAASIVAGTHDNTVAPFDMESARLQINSLKRMDEQADWFEIVLDPWHARRAIAQGKLAVILAVEMSHLLPDDDGPWKEQLWDLYDMGVRSIQIAHETNNDFSGAAYHVDLFEVVSQLKAWFDGNLDAPQSADGIHNDFGMTARGYELLREMIRLNMILDISHLPLKSQQEVYQVVSNEYNYYPLNNTHTRIDDLLLQKDKDVLKEFVTTDETLEYIRITGGVLGLRTGLQAMRTYPGSGVENSCDGSVRSLAQFYRYAADYGVATAFGSDFNGFIEQLPPRFGTYACATADEEHRQAQIDAQGTQNPDAPDYVLEYHQKGLAHIGLLPAVIHDLAEVGADTSDLEGSADAVVRMWERIYAEDRGPVE